MAVAVVFGSARPQPGEPLYATAEQVGGRLARAGYAVMTGGYGGVMEAASKGAKSAGGRTIGVTVAAFEKNGLRSRPNVYVDEEVKFETLPERLVHLCTMADAAVAVDGGIGTLAEIALTWNLIQSRALDPIPFVMVGPRWETILSAVYGDGAYIPEQYMQMWRTAHTVDDLIPLIENWHR